MEATYTLPSFFFFFNSLKSTLSKALNTVVANSKHDLNREALIMCKRDLTLSALRDSMLPPSSLIFFHDVKHFNLYRMYKWYKKAKLPWETAYCLVGESAKICGRGSDVSCCLFQNYVAPLTAEIYSIVHEMGAWHCLSRKDLSYMPQPVWPKELYPHGESPSSNTGCYPKIFIYLVWHFHQPSCMTRSGQKPCTTNRRTCRGFTWSFYFIPGRTGLSDISRHQQRRQTTTSPTSSHVFKKPHFFQKFYVNILSLLVCMHASF